VVGSSTVGVVVVESLPIGRARSSRKESTGNSPNYNKSPECPCYFNDIFPISFAQAFIIARREEFSAYQRENLLGKQRVETLIDNF